MHTRTKRSLQYTLQCLTAIFLALEIAIPPNPYRVHLIICLTALIMLKHDIPSKLIDVLEKYWKVLNK